MNSRYVSLLITLAFVLVSLVLSVSVAVKAKDDPTLLQQITIPTQLDEYHESQEAQF